ncbi:MAG: hypothetical protein BSOLF_1839 [Candidatus Carbobacillus altaicus]|uniref:Uncharacterized protein n=1 Tax=Candidatus Carbonibacillus altaicus TaxID=2163959 RepID=A0A2R6Y3Q5_9BACL|nr:MAG: hypothetical protein BSOLF_1839 [Candidatus Carbobacillus altaicus]
MHATLQIRAIDVQAKTFKKQLKRVTIVWFVSCSDVPVGDESSASKF